jgi:ferritin-like metal-binding protein YciE
MKPLHKVFWDEMAEMLHVQEMLLKALPRMSAAAEGAAFKEALEAYRLDLQKQSEKLRLIFRFFEMFAREKKCDGMMGLLVKGQQLIQRTGRGPALDAALLSVCRKITGYTQAAYSSLHLWSKLIMKSEPATVTSLKELLRNEMEADLRFSRLAAECDLEAANQAVESVRRASVPSRKVAREHADAGRWGEW